MLTFDKTRSLLDVSPNDKPEKHNYNACIIYLKYVLLRLNIIMGLPF